MFSNVSIFQKSAFVKNINHHNINSGDNPSGNNARGTGATRAQSGLNAIEAEITDTKSREFPFFTAENNVVDVNAMENAVTTLLKSCVQMKLFNQPEQTILVHPIHLYL
jgi:hypothetical protein